MYQKRIENRLVSSTGATNANLRYDPLGRLYETSGGSAGTTRFLYDGDELIAEYDGSGNMLRRYVHGSGNDDPMAWFEGASVSSGVARMLKTNHQGSVVALTDASGNLANINSYDEYGIPSSANFGRFQYTGQAWIPELKMYYYKARIYSPSLGRFMQTDPIGYKDQINLYAYVGDDPFNKTDPDGMQSCNAWGCTIPISSETRLEQQKQTEITKQISNQNAKELVIFYGSAVAGEVGISVAAKGLGLAYEGIANYKKFAPLMAGVKAERAVLESLGIAKNTKMYNGVIPDAVTKSAFVEVKDTAAVYATKQLKAMSFAARAEGKEFILYTRPDTYISAKARELFDYVRPFQ